MRDDEARRYVKWLFGLAVAVLVMAVLVIRFATW